MLKHEPATGSMTRGKDAPMRTLWQGAAIAALLTGTLAGCASPHYPIDANEAPGPAPLTAPHPQYSIDSRSPDPDQAPPPAAPPSAAVAQDAPDAAPLAAPVAPVQSESLPPPAPSADATPPSRPRSDGARLQYAAMTTPADAGDASPPMSTSSPPATPPAASSTAGATPPAAPPPPADASLTPQMVVHDQGAGAPSPTPPPPPASRFARPLHETVAPPPEAVRPAAGSVRFAASGEVVHASGEVFENYEVRRGDHIDALARAFSTTRTVLLDANAGLRAPYLLRPGQIVKVPVAKAYVAKNGDTLTAVARRFSVNADELAELNHVSLRATLRSGQEIGLPSSMRDRGPQRLSGGEAEYAEAEPASPPVTRQSASEYQPSPPQAAPVYQPSPVESTPHGRVVQVAPAPAMPTAPRPTTNYVTPAGPPPPAAAGYSDSEIAAAARGRFVWPVRGDVVQRFGPQGVGRRNDGVDIKAAQGTPVKAAASGEVVYAGDQVPGFGNLVLIKHADGWVTAYAHLDSVNVAMKQEVTQGQSLGSVGMSGGAVQPELHFEVRYAPSPADKAKPVDPVLVLPMG
jgi:murein DD-endopeptidase MepM/ murein hydrolase activator NlpD